MAFFHFGQAPLHPGLGLFVTTALVRTVSEGRDLGGADQAARIRRRGSGGAVREALDQWLEPLAVFFCHDRQHDLSEP